MAIAIIISVFLFFSFDVLEIRQRPSEVRSVFFVNNQKSLISSLSAQFKKGKVSLKERQKIMAWSKCLSASSGAKYLESVLNLKNSRKHQLKLPWN